MFNFIIKGLFRDRSRSFFPVFVVLCGVFLVFLGDCFIRGVFEDLIASNANFDTGHVKIVSHPYSEELSIRPLELSLETPPEFFDNLKKKYPDFRWTRRTSFGCLLDIPDENMETKAQAPVAALAMDFLSPGSVEEKNIGIKKSLKEGRFIRADNEILVTKNLADTLKIKTGETATLFTSTVDGAQTSANFKIVGIIKFGIAQLDKATIILDISGSDEMQDMEGYTAELLGFSSTGFNRKKIIQMKNSFNAEQDKKDEFRAHMLSLEDQNNLKSLLDANDFVTGIILGLFIFLMTMVLWNAGLISGIRRYSEIGLRMAIGEKRYHIILTLLSESLFTGLAGTILGILLALPFAWYFQEYGIDYSEHFKDISIMMSGIMKGKITVSAFVVSMIPGIFASFLGTLMSTFGIFKRDTASLFKELET